MNVRYRLPLLFVLLSVLTVGCVQETKTIKKSKKSSLPLPKDKATCGASTVYAGGVTISGKAVYQRRLLGGGGLGAVDGTPKNIRFAEYEVYNDAGVKVQCGYTDDQGDYSFDVPVSAGTHSIQINSRASNSTVNASVQNDPYSFTHYSVSTTFVPDGNKALANIVASATGDVVGGAFNVFDQIVEANIFLNEMTTNCNADFADCTPFSVAPRVYAYWKLGFNPATYFGSSSGISFYLPGRSQLFILGGSNGDYQFSDTDHFDNTVVLHEYGHFIEDVYSITDSPGGFHDADSVIDPRLAWSEGWATFFALTVQRSPIYRDTIGISQGYLILENLETAPGSRDVPTRSGEGNFREFSIVRALWDIHDPYTFDSVTVNSTDGGGGDTVDADFKELWTVFHGSDSTDAKFRDSDHAFRDYGLFMKLQDELIDVAKTDFSDIFTIELQEPSRRDYAALDSVVGGACADKTIQATISSSSVSGSDLFGSNDFYHLKHSGGAITITLNYDDDGNAGTEPITDLDLYIYEEDYIFGTASDMVGTSNSSTDSGNESITVSLSAGDYLVNVHVDTTVSLGLSTDYTLTFGGEQVCP